MRWFIIALFAYVLLGLEQGLSVALQEPTSYHLAPGFLLILAVYLGLFAPPMVVLWSWLALGVLYDLVHPVRMPEATRDAVILGPGAIGYLLGAFAILRLRGVVYRGSPISIAIFTFVVGILVHLGIVMIFSLRGLSFLFFPGERLIQWSWASELVSRFLSLILTSLIALPVGWVLLNAGSGMLGHDVAKGSAVRR